MTGFADSIPSYSMLHWHTATENISKWPLASGRAGLLPREARLQIKAPNQCVRLSVSANSQRTYIVTLSNVVFKLECSTPTSLCPEDYWSNSPGSPPQRDLPFCPVGVRSWLHSPKGLLEIYALIVMTRMGLTIIIWLKVREAVKHYTVHRSYL